VPRILCVARGDSGGQSFQSLVGDGSRCKAAPNELTVFHALVAGADVVVKGFQNQIALLRFVFAESNQEATILTG
jgi:hypothetical protein